MATAADHRGGRDGSSGADAPAAEPAAGGVAAAAASGLSLGSLLADATFTAATCGMEMCVQDSLRRAHAEPPGPARSAGLAAVGALVEQRARESLRAAGLEIEVVLLIGALMGRPAYASASGLPDS
eukprot:SAG22_NODE_11769_length_470_cov_0.827493_1_plen_125_part_10